jgi:hypothetical protein
MQFETELKAGCEDGASRAPSPLDEASQPVKTLPPVTPEQAADLPAAFDWRDYQGGNWMTPVKDQGSCGSCWAFGAVGAVEAAQNIRSNNPDLDLDLSEEYLVTDCSPLDGTCCGGSNASALMYIQDFGIPDEACLPYDSGSGCSCFGSGTCTNCAYSTSGQCANHTCSDRCSDWASRLVTIDPSAEISLLAADIPTIKKELVENGPLSALWRCSAVQRAGHLNCPQLEAQPCGRPGWLR